MSLINDALKRARHAEPIESSAPPPAMLPVEHSRRARVPKILLPIALMMLAMAVWIILKGLAITPANDDQNALPVWAREPEKFYIPPALLAELVQQHPEFRPIASRILSNMTNTARPVEAPRFVFPTPPPPPPLAAQQPPAQVPQLPAPPGTVPGSATPPSAVPGPAPTMPNQAQVLAAAQTPPPAPTYKLGGIILRPTRPAAVVNNKTVYVGDKIGKARVKSITEDTVILEQVNGQLVELTLE